METLKLIKNDFHQNKIDEVHIIQLVIQSNFEAYNNTILYIFEHLKRRHSNI